MTVCSHLLVMERQAESAKQMKGPMIPGHTTAVTRATMNTEAVAAGVTRTAPASMIVATATTTEDTAVHATTTAVAVMTTGGTRAAHKATEPYMVEYRLWFPFPEPVLFSCLVRLTLPPVLAFLYVFHKSSIELNTIGFWLKRVCGWYKSTFFGRRSNT